MTSKATLASVPLLFLDFDGVLHPSLQGIKGYFTRAPLLSDALDGLACDIVISSSWRFHFPPDELPGYLMPLLRERVVGFTGPAVVGRHARYMEIQSYVKRRAIVSWRALDDSFFEFPDNCPQLILCDGSIGIQEPQMVALRKWLSEVLSVAC